MNANPCRFSVEAERAAKTLHEEVQRLNVATANAARRCDPDSLQSIAHRASETITSATALMHRLMELRHEALRLRGEVVNAVPSDP